MKLHVRAIFVGINIIFGYIFKYKKMLRFLHFRNAYKQFYDILGSIFDEVLKISLVILVAQLQQYLNLIFFWHFYKLGPFFEIKVRNLHITYLYTSRNSFNFIQTTFMPIPIVELDSKHENQSVHFPVILLVPGFGAKI